MATFYLRTSNYGANKKAASNASYILGEGKYSDKEEVSHSEANNLPDFAQNDPVAFFRAADNNERERSARGFVFAIPHEAQDRNKWASDFAKDLCGNAPYLLAVHDKDGNSHAHILMSERTLDPKKSLKKNATKTVDPSKLTEEKFFSRVNGKDRTFSRVDFVENVKDNLYLSHIRRVAPDYTPAKDSGELKIGPDLKHASTTYKEERQERAALVQEWRETKTEIATLEKIMLTSTAKEKSTTNTDPTANKSESELQTQVMQTQQDLMRARGRFNALNKGEEKTKAEQRVQQLQSKLDKEQQALEKRRRPEQKQKQPHQPHQPQPQQQQPQGQGAQLSKSSNNDTRDMDRREQDILRKEQQSQNQSGKLNDEEQRYRQQEDARRQAMATETQKAQEATAKDLQQPQNFPDNRQNDTFFKQAQEKADTPERAHLANWLTKCPPSEYQQAMKIFNKTGGQTPALGFKARLDQTYNTLKEMAAEYQQQAKTSAQHTAKASDGWKKFQRPTLTPYSRGR